jgi:opacity protein-like surface antigen
MSRKRLWIAALSALLMFAAFAAAQDEKNEIGGNLGRIFISDQGIQGATYFDPTIHFGKGLTFDIEYARHIFVAPVYSISGEVIFADDPKTLLNAGDYGNAVVPQSIKSYFITPAARVNLFPTTAVSPWISLGAGAGHFSQSPQLDYSGPNPGKSTTGFTLEGGLGLDVKVWKQLSIRGGVRDFWAGEPDFPLAPTGKSHFHNYFVFGGAFWRF